MTGPAKIAYTREEAADQVGVSVYKIRAAIRDNELAARRNGKDISVAHEALMKWFKTWEVA